MWAKRLLPAAFQLWPLWTYFHIHTIGEHLYFSITVLPKRAKMSATLLENSTASKLWLIIDSKLDFHTDCAASLILKDVVLFFFWQKTIWLAYIIMQMISMSFLLSPFAATLFCVFHQRDKAGSFTSIIYVSTCSWLTYDLHKWLLILWYEDRKKEGKAL